MERLDGAGLQEVPEEARSLTSRAACCQSAIRRVESPLCCSHARQGLTSRHGVTPKRVNRVNPVTTRMPSNIRTTVPKTTVRGSRGESTCCAKRSKRKKTARSYAALRRAAYYPLDLTPYCKAFMACLGFWRSASLRSAIFLLNWSPAQRCHRSTTPPVEAFSWEPTTGAIELMSEGPLPSRPESICRSNTPGIPVWSGFRPDRFLVYFVLRETFWD